MNFFWFPLEDLPFIVLAMLVAFTVHEFAHAWTAYKFGDSTAYEAGRVTLNPMAHIDWIGLIFLVVAGFGWAKPVPVRRSRFKRPRLMSILVTAAGPFSNLLLAFIVLFVFYALVAAGVMNDSSDAALATLWTFLKYWLQINFVLFIFNLIPLPPLDGYRIVEEFAPLRIRLQLQRFEQWSFFIFLLLVFVPPLRAATIGPLFELRDPIFRGMLDLLGTLFGSSVNESFINLLIKMQMTVA
ncbi:site-2 protease family protein [Cohnella faecalis]|uniref:Site-2 protease family protein n=1 Tax=Cohnella faecalis TaxID=2315694 RepID=A0A398CZ28_9BACL|nr:site-2 protease family protein [Cohnella faecalis]RIE04184.1 site-2 protease family protein [Cohnella faecalis]